MDITAEERAQVNRILSAETEPVFTLGEILAMKTEAERQELSRQAGTEDLRSWLLDPDTFAMLLKALTPRDFALFSRAADAPFLREEKVFLPLHAGLIRFVLMQPYWVKGELYLVVPSELRSLWQDLKTAGFPEKKRRRDLIDCYALACVKLYGVLTLEDYFYILRERGGLEQSCEAEELLQALAGGSAYALAGDLLLYPGLDPQSAGAYLEARKGLPLYLPDHEKLMYMAEWGYYDIFRDLEDWRLEVEDAYRLSGAEAPKQRAESFADSLYAMLRTELVDREHGEFFAAWNVPPDEKRMRKLKDQTRLWCLNGNTPRELFALMEKGRLRPGVNRPCPCGSGRKYKKCHGAA